MHFANPDSSHDDLVTEGLLSRGWLAVSGPGLIACTGAFLALCDYFDGLFETLAYRRGAQPHNYPGIIPRQVLERLEYFTSFPGVATPAGDTHVLSPAVCYHTYQLLENYTFPRHPFVITAVGRCCRFEGSRLTRSPERLWNFTMREIVFF